MLWAIEFVIIDGGSFPGVIASAKPRQQAVHDNSPTSFAALPRDPAPLTILRSPEVRSWYSDHFILTAAGKVLHIAQEVNGWIRFDRIRLLNLLLARLMNQYGFACGRLSLSSVVVCNAVGVPANFPCPTLDLQLTGDHICR